MTQHVRHNEPEASGQDAFRLGLRSEERGDFPAAVKAYHTAYQLGHAGAAVNLGVLLQESGDLLGAEEAFRRADERGDATGAFHLAWLLQESGDRVGAEEAYRRADLRGHRAAGANLRMLRKSGYDGRGSNRAAAPALGPPPAPGAEPRPVPVPHASVSTDPVVSSPPAPPTRPDGAGPESRSSQAARSRALDQVDADAGVGSVAPAARPPEEAAAAAPTAPAPPIDGESAKRSTTKPITGRSLISGTMLNYFGAAVLAATGFFLTPFMIHTLGRRHYGILSLVAATIGYVTLLDLGLGTSAMKLISESADLADRSRVKQLLSTVVALYVILGVVVAVVMLAAYPLIKNDFHVLPADRPTLKWCYLLCVVSVSVCFPQAVYTATITAHRNFSVLNQLSIGQALASAAGVVLVLKLGLGIVSIAGVSAVVNITGFLARIIFVRSRFGVAFSTRQIEISAFKDVASFAGWVFIINMFGMIIFNTDTLVVGAILGPAAVASYQVALSPNQVLQSFAGQMSVVTFTAAAALRAAGDHVGVRRLFLESTRVATVFVVPFGIAVAAWGSAFLRLWVGPKFESSDSALLFLTLAIMQLGIQGTAGQVIISYGRQKLMAMSVAIEGIANLTVSILLGKKIGITGVALGTWIPTTIMMCLVGMPLALRLTKTSPRDLITRIGLPLVEAVAVTLLLRTIVPAASFHSIITLALAGGALVLAFVAFNLLLLSSERDTYRSYVMRRLRPAAA